MAKQNKTKQSSFDLECLTQETSSYAQVFRVMSSSSNNITLAKITVHTIIMNVCPHMVHSTNHPVRGCKFSQTSLPNEEMYSSRNFSVLDVMPCSLMDRYTCSEGNCYLHLQGLRQKFTTKRRYHSTILQGDVRT